MRPHRSFCPLAFFPAPGRFFPNPDVSRETRVLFNKSVENASFADSRRCPDTFTFHIPVSVSPSYSLRIAPFSAALTSPDSVPGISTFPHLFYRRLCSVQQFSLQSSSDLPRPGHLGDRFEEGSQSPWPAFAHARPSLSLSLDFLDGPAAAEEPPSATVGASNKLHVYFSNTPYLMLSFRPQALAGVRHDTARRAQLAGESAFRF